MNPASASAAVFNPDVGSFYHARPAWLQGHISFDDARFLHAVIQREKPALALEIGSASGFSAAIICHALESAARAGRGVSDYRVVSYDKECRFYADATKRVGDAAREQLAADLLAHVEFRNPRTAADAADEFPAGSIGFVFIDADHLHPWPALDLFAVCRIVRPGAAIVLHDINLSVLAPGETGRGASHLFHGLTLEKECASPASGLPNIGLLRIPNDTSRLAAHILAVINAHPWESDVSSRSLARLGLRRSGASRRLSSHLGRWLARCMGQRQLGYELEFCMPAVRP